MKSTWPGSVQQVDGVTTPIELHTGTEDGDPSFLFLGIVVRVGGAMIDTTNSVLGAAEEQHAFGHRRLPSVNVGNDSDVANP